MPLEGFFNAQADTRSSRDIKARGLDARPILE